jgi:hypothetical protein
MMFVQRGQEGSQVELGAPCALVPMGSGRGTTRRNPSSGQAKTAIARGTDSSPAISAIVTSAAALRACVPVASSLKETEIVRSASSTCALTLRPAPYEKSVCRYRVRAGRPFVSKPVIC